MTIDVLNKDMITFWKLGEPFKKKVLANMIDAVKKASMTSKGRVEITEALVDETLAKYQKTVQEQYDTCPDGEEYAQRKADYLAELSLVKMYAPRMITDYEEVKQAVMAVLNEYGPVEALCAKSNRGTVMKIVAPAMKGKADMSVVNKVVGELLV